MSKKVVNKKPGSYVYSQTEQFKLVSGKTLTHLDLAYETYGTINTQKDNVILLHHSLSMSAHAANLANNLQNKTYDYDQQSNAGWWDNMIGPSKPLDTNKYYIICINNLGSCFGSTGPSNYGKKFPVITIHDIAVSQKLLLDYLGIPKIKLIIGSSMGGMISLAWLQLYPDSLENLFVAACAHKAYPTNIFNRMIQQEIINLGECNAEQGLKVARMLGFFNYRSGAELNERFNNSLANVIIADLDFETNPAYQHFELFNYFSHNADKFTNSFDVRSYLCMLNAMDLFDLSVAKSYHPQGYPSQNKINIVVTGITTDILFPLWQQQEVYELLQSCGYQPTFIEHESSYGHDAFLKEYEEFGQYITSLLNNQTKATGIKNNQFCI